MPIAEPKDIRLVRPGRGGKPAKVYKVDLEAIRDKGDCTFELSALPRRPADRRPERSRQEDRGDRPLNAPIQSSQLNPTDGEFAACRRRISTRPVPRRSGEISSTSGPRSSRRKGDLKFDEETLREALLQKRKTAPVPQP